MQWLDLETRERIGIHSRRKMAAQHYVGSGGHCTATTSAAARMAEPMLLAELADSAT